MVAAPKTLIEFDSLLLRIDEQLTKEWTARDKERGLTVWIGSQLQPSELAVLQRARVQYLDEGWPSVYVVKKGSWFGLEIHNRLLR